jgi:hypothetical protein
MILWYQETIPYTKTDYGLNVEKLRFERKIAYAISCLWFTVWKLKMANSSKKTIEEFLDESFEVELDISLLL